jgi:hydrogenase maturation protein HypF
MNRRAIAVSGIVQGVGFRPFVYGLAARLGLGGFVRNETGVVRIEVEGDDVALDRFLDELATRPPVLARIERVRWQSCRPRGERDFRIEPSIADRAQTVFPAADVATCAECLTELFDPGDRRYRYPFLNCTQCGPRLTIIRSMPYDRDRTTMASFVLCPECRAEYEDPANRRFHAQPIACPACGPRLTLSDAQGIPVPSSDPLSDAARLLRQGGIVALKGLGGYHLACDALDPSAVAALRTRKHRDEKPFALMVRDVAAARRFADVSPAEEALLTSPRRPIVVLRRRTEGAAAADVGANGGAVAVAAEVAPRNPWLGVMLPYTPLHHLLLEAVQPLPLVMTSGNRSDEPIAYDDGDAVRRLAGIADGFLTHDRPIETRCDDSVVRVVGGVDLPVRRSRGYAPEPLRLPRTCHRPTLALGGQWKATFALGHGRHAFLSHHIGDLDHYEAYRAYAAGIAHFERLFSITPERLVHDLHPDYASTRYARERNQSSAAPDLLIPVQHHHAHIASCMAENGVDEPVVGVAFDGTGYGLDGTVWGGEFLMADYREFRRVAHLRPVVMPGGEQAIREPWRMALAHLHDAGLDDSVFANRAAPGARATVRHQIERRLNAPWTSSMGRLFDAVAALVGLCPRARFEGQAAIELEGLATGLAPDGSYPFALVGDSPVVIDTRPLIAAVLDDATRGRNAAEIGRRFHSTVVEIVAQVCSRLAGASGLASVAFSGGVFLNALLTAEAGTRLERDGFRVYRHRHVPPSDGGLCLGQLAIAAAQP